MIFLFSGRKLHPSFSLLLLRLSYSFAFTIRSHFYQHCCDRTPTQPTNLFCIMAQIRRRCLTLNDHTLINFSPSTIFPLRSVFFPPKKYIPACKMIVIHTHPHIYFIRRPLSLYFFPVFFFFMSAALSNGLCIKLHNKVICTLSPEFVSIISPFKLLCAALACVSV